MTIQSLTPKRETVAEPFDYEKWKKSGKPPRKTKSPEERLKTKSLDEKLRKKFQSNKDLRNKRKTKAMADEETAFDKGNLNLLAAAFKTAVLNKVSLPIPVRDGASICLAPNRTGRDPIQAAAAFKAKIRIIDASSTLIAKMYLTPDRERFIVAKGVARAITFVAYFYPGCFSLELNSELAT